MWRAFSRTIFILVFAALLSHSALAAEAGGIPGKTEVQLTQQAVRVMARDRIRATVRIEGKGSNGRQIQADINKRMAAALEKVKQHPAIVAATGSYTVYRDYNNKDTEFWNANQTLSLSSEDFEAVLALVGDLQGNGLLMSGMQFFLAPETLAAVQDDLTAAALDALRARADNVAKDLGMVIEHYKVIAVGNAQEDRGEAQGRRAGATAAVAGKAPPPAAQAGDATVTLTVTATVILAPRKTS
jgi:predicted secreted protein